MLLELSLAFSATVAVWLFLFDFLGELRWVSLDVVLLKQNHKSLHWRWMSLFFESSNKVKVLCVPSQCGFLQWNVDFIRAAHDREVDALTSFFTLFYSHRVRWEGKDKLWWALAQRGCLILAPFVGSLLVKMAFLFTGRVFGRPMFLSEWLSPLGQWP